MTSEQAEWLRQHPEHQPIGAGGAGGGTTFSGGAAPGRGRARSRGVLHLDGRFEPIIRGTKLPGLPEPGKPAAFVVGILIKPGEEVPLDMSQYSIPRQPGAVAPTVKPQPQKDPRDYVTNWNVGGGGGLKPKT